MPRPRAAQSVSKVEDSPRRSTRKRTRSEVVTVPQPQSETNSVTSKPQVKANIQLLDPGDSTLAHETSVLSEIAHRSKSLAANKNSRANQRPRAKREEVASEDEAQLQNTAENTTKTTGNRKVAAKTNQSTPDSLNSHHSTSRKSTGKVETDHEKSVVTSNPSSAPQDPVKKKRKTKEEKEAEAMPLAARTQGLNMFVGAHTSIAKGVENAVHNCVHIGGNAFACFLKSQRKWENPPLKDENRDAFRRSLQEHRYDGMAHVVPHGSYLVNLATADPEKAEQSYRAFVDDLQRCESLGIRYYNFHPGAAGQTLMADAIQRLAKNLNRALDETKTVVPLLENMAGTGSIIGGRFEDLGKVISHIKPEYQARIGVCLDTCHAFAAGYDLRTPEAFKKTLQDFDEIVGIRYLKALHINDSKAPFSSKRDLHQNIGLGFLGLRAFHSVMNEPRFHNLPLILETPCDRPDPQNPAKTIEDKGIWAREIKLLESMIDLDPNSATYRAMEQKLSDEGRLEREKMQKSFDKKTAETQKKLAKAREKGQGSLKDMLGGGGPQKKERIRVKASRPRSRSKSLSSASGSSIEDASD